MTEKIKKVKKYTGIHCANNFCFHGKKDGFQESTCIFWKCTQIQKRGIK